MFQASAHGYEAGLSLAATEYYDGSQEGPEGTRTPRPPPIQVPNPDGDIASTSETGSTPGVKSFDFGSYDFGRFQAPAGTYTPATNDLAYQFSLSPFSELDASERSYETFLVFIGERSSPEIESTDTFFWQGELYPVFAGPKRLSSIGTRWPDDRGDGVQREDVRSKTWYMPTSDDKHDMHEPNTALPDTYGPVLVAKLQNDDKLAKLNESSWRR